MELGAPKGAGDRSLIISVSCRFCPYLAGMVKKLKVWGWQGTRLEARIDRNFHGQTREIVAAASRAEVGRIMGVPARSLFNICETGNKRELEIARANPGVVYWAPLNIFGAPYTPVHQR